MPIRLRDPQRLRAAYALSDSRFCVTIHEMQDDDPFSIILEYDSSYPQPWTRVEVRRNIVDITARADLAKPDRPFVAVSDEGGIYFLRDDARTEKIPGAGVYSEDAENRGPIRGIAFLGGQLHACGEGGQLYRRDDFWERLVIVDEEIQARGRLEKLRRGRLRRFLRC